MKTVVLGDPPAVLVTLFEERKRPGLDTHDEIWNGEYHMAPAAAFSHGRMQGLLGSFEGTDLSSTTAAWCSAFRRATSEPRCPGRRESSRRWDDHRPRRYAIFPTSGSGLCLRTRPPVRAVRHRLPGAPDVLRGRTAPCLRWPVLSACPRNGRRRSSRWSR
jgi:hypothetical protein